MVYSRRNPHCKDWPMTPITLPTFGMQRKKLYGSSIRTLSNNSIEKNGELELSGSPFSSTRETKIVRTFWKITFVFLFSGRVEAQFSYYRTRPANPSSVNERSPIIMSVRSHVAQRRRFRMNRKNHGSNAGCSFD